CDGPHVGAHPSQRERAADARRDRGRPPLAGGDRQSVPGPARPAGDRVAGAAAADPRRAGGHRPRRGLDPAVRERPAGRRGLRPRDRDHPADHLGGAGQRHDPQRSAPDAGRRRAGSALGRGGAGAPAPAARRRAHDGAGARGDGRLLPLPGRSPARRHRRLETLSTPPPGVLDHTSGAQVRAVKLSTTRHPPQPAGRGDSMAASGPSQSAQERREAQREALRKQRRAELSRQRTVRTVVIAAITVVALAIVATAGYFVYQATRPAGPVAVPEGMSADQPYLSLGAPEDSGKPVVEIHLDFLCAHCGEFEKINSEDLQTMVAEDEATVHIVPRNFMDPQSSSGDYSSRAANALVAVYADDPANAMVFQQLMFANQPGAE